MVSKREQEQDDEEFMLALTRFAKDGDKNAVSVGDLMRMCNIQARRTKNKRTRILLLNCGYALRQLVDRIDKLENPMVTVQ